MNPTPDPHRSPVRRRALLQAAATGAVLAGSACARIPSHSPIAVQRLGDAGLPGAPYVQAQPPRPGATPAEVVAGFVQAGVGSEDNFAVAREYLAPDYRETWAPRASVIVYAGSHELAIDTQQESTVNLTVHALATVDDRGLRTLLAGPTPRSVTFRLMKVREQWRITAAPDGIFLSEAAFETLFDAARLYFLDARRRFLVPDPRWYPVQRGVASVLEGLAAGPTGVLEGAVKTAVPRTSGVSDATITSSADGRTQVVVPAVIGDLPATQRALALAQLENSLRSLRSLPDVALVWAGEDRTPAHQVALSRPVPRHRPMGAGPAGIISLGEPAAGGRPQQLVPDLARTPVRHPTIDRAGVLAAALTEDFTSVLLASTDGSIPLREAATGGAFAPPCADGCGYIWASTRASSGVMLALAGKGPGADVAVEGAWLSGREVLSLQISTDDTRMFVLSRDASRTRLDLCTVRRDDDGTPLELSEPLSVRTVLDEVIQVSWYEEMAALILGTDPSTSERRARIIDFSSTRDALPALKPGTDAITGTAVDNSMWATTTSGELLRSEGDAWRVVDLPAKDPAFY